MSKNLVELMEQTYRSQKTRDGYYCGYPIEVCKQLLSVVKEHIGEVAEVCPDCNGTGYIYSPNEVEGIFGQDICHICNGTGVIARTEGDVCLKK